MVIENVGEGWGIGINDPNPDENNYIPMPDKETAFIINQIIELAIPTWNPDNFTGLIELIKLQYKKE